MRLVSLFRYALGILVAICYKIRYWKGLTYTRIPSLKKGFSLLIRLNGRAVLTRFGHAGQMHIAVPGGNLKIGEDVYFNHNAIITCRRKIVIGDGCRFGPNLGIFDHDHVFNTNGVANGDAYNLGEIEIGPRCWIGANVVVLRNTVIGEGSVIGAGCVLSGVIPPHSLVTACRDLRIIPIEERG